MLLLITVMAGEESWRTEFKGFEKENLGVRLSQRVACDDFFKASDDVLFCNRYWVVIKMSAVWHDVVCSLVEWLF